MQIGIGSFAIGSSYFAQQATKPLACVHENDDRLRLHWDLTKRGKKKKNFKSSDAVHSEVCLQTSRTFQFFKRAHKEGGWTPVQKHTDSLDHKERLSQCAVSCLRFLSHDYETAGLIRTCWTNHDQPQGLCHQKDCTAMAAPSSTTV